MANPDNPNNCATCKHKQHGSDAATPKNKGLVK